MDAASAGRALPRLVALAGRPDGPGRAALARRCRYAVRAALRRQLARALAVLRASRRKATGTPLDALTAAAVLASIDDSLRGPIVHFGTAAWALGARTQSAVLARTPRLTTASSQYAAFLEGKLRDDVRLVNQHTRDRVAAILELLGAEGGTVEQAEAELEGQRDAGVFSDARADGIGDYEVHHAAVAGGFAVALLVHAEDAPVEKRWRTVGDARVEERCEGNEAQGWIPADEPHASGHDVPLAHNRCRCDEEFRRA